MSLPERVGPPLTFEDAQRTAHQIAKEHGWWGEYGLGARNTPEMLALMHSELSEALEEWRVTKHAEPGGMELSGVYRISPTGKPEGFWIELADCIIRILDTAERENINMGELVRMKMEYNRTRPHRHGGKRA